jgi:hypothetical protein
VAPETALAVDQPVGRYQLTGGETATTKLGRAPGDLTVQLVSGEVHDACPLVLVG